MPTPEGMASRRTWRASLERSCSREQQVAAPHRAVGVGLYEAGWSAIITRGTGANGRDNVTRLGRYLRRKAVNRRREKSASYAVSTSCVGYLRAHP